MPEALTPDYLHRLEAQFGKGRERVTRRKVSPNDPRLTKVKSVRDIPGSMVSCGRMVTGSPYPEVYADQLLPYLEKRFVLVELGVLLGVGLAIWCEIFTRARIIGLDIDPGLFREAELRKRGAFRHNQPEIHLYDEIAADCGNTLATILAGERIDVFIDDALHDDGSILKCMATVLPFMADGFKYVIEDNGTVDQHIKKLRPDLNVIRTGKITVVTP